MFSAFLTNLTAGLFVVPSMAGLEATCFHFAPDGNFDWNGCYRRRVAPGCASRAPRGMVP